MCKVRFGSLASSPETVPLILMSSSALFDASSFGVRWRREELVIMNKPHQIHGFLIFSRRRPQIKDRAVPRLLAREVKVIFRSTSEEEGDLSLKPTPVLSKECTQRRRRRQWHRSPRSHYILMWTSTGELSLKNYSTCLHRKEHKENILFTPIKTVQLLVWFESYFLYNASRTKILFKQESFWLL